MRMRALAIWSLAALAVAGAVALWLQYEPPDPYVVHLEERVEALLPDVERELGAKVPGPIRLVVSTREEMHDLMTREYRDLLTAVEGEQPEEDPDAYQWRRSMHGMLGCVDDEGTIHICRQNLERAPHTDSIGSVIDRYFGIGEPDGPEVLDGVLIHELVHLYQLRSQDLHGYLRGARHHGDLLARRTVSEGHAEVVTARVAEERGLPGSPRPNLEPDPRMDQFYNAFDSGNGLLIEAYPSLWGGLFVESAFERLGRDQAVRRLFAEPPSLHQSANPETWPGPKAADAGTDRMLRRMRRWLALQCKSEDCLPAPAPIFLRLLSTASTETQAAAQRALLEAQRISAEGDVLSHSVRGYLLAAADDAAGKVLHDAWVEAAQARDAVEPTEPKYRPYGVVESSWANPELDGLSALLAERSYRGSWPTVEHAVVVRRGRYVLEIRLRNDPGGAEAALRVARRLLACVVESIEQDQVDAASWDARWRAATGGTAKVTDLRKLLTDSDPDVRQAALRALFRKGVLDAEERARLTHDTDPLVRLTALTRCSTDDETALPDVLDAIADDHPWVAAGGCDAAKAHYLAEDIPLAEFARLLRRPEATVRRAVGRLLDGYSNSGDESDDEWLAVARMALADDDSAVRACGVETLLHMAEETPGLGETLAEVLQGLDEQLVNRALGVLVCQSNGVPGTATALIPFLADEDRVVDAIEVLGKLGDEALPAVPELRRIADAAQAEGEVVRGLAALTAVASITGNPADAIELNGLLLKQGTPAQAMRAAQALGLLLDRGTPKAAVEGLVPPLAGLLLGDQRNLKLEVLSVLEKLGPVAVAALSAVEPLCDSDDTILAKAAQETRDSIRKIEPE